MKRLRPIDIAIVLCCLAAALGIAVRLQRPDLVSPRLTDLSKREEITIIVALPGPWGRSPLRELPTRSERVEAEGGRDFAVFEGFTPDTTLPAARFRVRARIDRSGQRWFNYGEILPGADFTFRTDRFVMQGMVREVLADPTLVVPGGE